MYSSPPIFVLCTNDFCIHNLGCCRSDIVHSPYPSHRISGFQCLSDTVDLGHLMDNGIQLLLGLLVNICQVAVQLATQLQAGVKDLAVLPNVPQVPLTPQANRPPFFLW